MWKLPGLSSQESSVMSFMENKQHYLTSKLFHTRGEKRVNKSRKLNKHDMWCWHDDLYICGIKQYKNLCEDKVAPPNCNPWNRHLLVIWTDVTNHILKNACEISLISVAINEYFNNNTNMYLIFLLTYSWDT